MLKSYGVGGWPVRLYCDLLGLGVVVDTLYFPFLFSHSPFPIPNSQFLIPIPSPQSQSPIPGPVPVA